MPEIQATADSPADPRTQRRVRNYLLDTQLQLRLASYLLAVGAVLSAGLGWLLWSAYRETSQVLELSDPQVGAPLGLALAQADRGRILAVGVALIAVLVCLLAAAIMVTHRIAGPAYAIRMTCRRIAEGSLGEPRSLRERDLLVELGEEVAAMVRALRGREARDRDAMSSAAALLRDAGAPPERRLEAARALEAIAEEKERRLLS